MPINSKGGKVTKEDEAYYDELLADDDLEEESDETSAKELDYELELENEF